MSRLFISYRCREHLTQSYYFVIARTISSNLQRPKAEEEFLEYEFATDPFLTSRKAITVEICGPLVFVLFTLEGGEDTFEEHGSEMGAWNWQTGKRILVSGLQDSAVLPHILVIQTHNGGKSNIESFTLINPSLLMVVIHNLPSLERYFVDFQPRLVLYSIQTNSDGTISLVHAQTLRLPPPHASSFLSRRRIHIHRLTILSDPWLEPSIVTLPSNPPFDRDPTQRIFVVELSASSLVDQDRSAEYTRLSSHRFLWVLRSLTSRFLELPPRSLIFRTPSLQRLTSSTSKRRVRMRLMRLNLSPPRKLLALNPWNKP